MARFIDDRENYANETYIHLTMESKSNLKIKNVNTPMFINIIVVDFLFRNQIKMHVLDALQHLTDKILNDCSRNPKSVGAFMVS